MANTLKRNVYEIKGSSTNYSKYYTQLNFTGIKHIKNIFEADQMSFSNTKNVYVDTDYSLVSRLPLITQETPKGFIITSSGSISSSVARNNFVLVDKYISNNINIFISSNGHKYEIAALNEISKELKFAPNLVTKYHVSVIEKYIIVFNNVDAIVLDTDNFSNGWKYLREMSEIPITKRIIGQQVYNNSVNQFTNSYKEEYILSDDTLPILPNGTAEVTINQSPTNLNWTLPDANVNTEFRILRSANIVLEGNDLISVATNTNTGVTVIAVARDNYVMLSLDDGLSFERVLYPASKTFLNIASISKDALYFFFVARDGVYRYSLADKTWVIIELVDSNGNRKDLAGNGNNVCCFNNSEVFSFVLYREESGQAIADLYCKGPGLKMPNYSTDNLGYVSLVNKINPLTQNNKTRKDLGPYSILVKVKDDTTNIVMWTQATEASSVITYVLGGKTDCIYRTFNISNKYGAITDFEVLTQRPNSTYPFEGISISGLASIDNNWKIVSAIIGLETRVDELVEIIDFAYLQSLDIAAADNGAPLSITNAYIANKTIYSVDGIANLPIENLSISTTVSIGKYYYIKVGKLLYTNKMITDSSVSLIYTYISETPYNKVPNASYTNNELYLAFDNVLQITSNAKNGTDIQFNLPAINNQVFSSNIAGLINISTTEIAIFLTDRIYIVTQVADETFGYRYDYTNTRLSAGVRIGDTIINTRNGVYTLYPTLQGLAVMNYQADMATTDQIVEYVTNDIIDIWTEFYNNGNIRIIQMRDYVYLSNGTKQYLMLDLRNMSWWQFEVPIVVQKLITDQVDLEVISNGLHKFEKNYIKYRDFNTKYINWSIESQPLHFNLPTYYKNIKQLVFQFAESISSQQTINAQVKLYRKSISYKEPEAIAFTVDEYRTFIKRFNYWKINELQWGLSTDTDTEIPARLKLNCISIKYEQGEEVRA